MSVLESSQQNSLERHPFKPQLIPSGDVNRPLSIPCVFCGEKSFREILDIGAQPYANALLRDQNTHSLVFPLLFGQCRSCGHYQRGFTSSVTFDSDYPYRTGVNEGYLRQQEKWLRGLGLHRDHHILEIGCNDGSLLRIFERNGFHVLWGIDPCAPDSDSIVFKREEFLKTHLPSESFDWIIANNVLAHVPDLRETLIKIRRTLTKEGIFSCEVPLLENLVQHLQYDTIYHEHYSYFTRNSLIQIAESVGLYCYKLEEIDSHGGSGRFYFRKAPTTHFNAFPEPDFRDFAFNVRHSRRNWITRIHHKASHARLAVFGAAAKGITWLNHCGFTQQEFSYCVDETPEKQGKFIPLARIPIVPMETLLQNPPQYLYILPWNFGDEIKRKLRKYKQLKNTVITVVQK